MALNGLKDAKFIFDNVPIAHTVVVVGEGGIAEQTARIIAAKKIEVKFFGALSQPIEGVDVITDQAIAEILGDSDAKAVRLSNQKVLGASLVIFTGPTQPQCDFLKESEIKTNRGILVDESLRTNCPFVFAVGDVSESSNGEKQRGWGLAQAEGRRLGELPMSDIANIVSTTTQKLIEAADSLLKETIRQKGENAFLGFEGTAFYLPLCYALTGLEIKDLKGAKDIIAQARLLSKKESLANGLKISASGWALKPGDGHPFSRGVAGGFNSRRLWKAIWDLCLIRSCGLLASSWSTAALPVSR